LSRRPAPKPAPAPPAPVSVPAPTVAPAAPATQLPPGIPTPQAAPEQHLIAEEPKWEEPAADKTPAQDLEPETSAEVPPDIVADEWTTTAQPFSIDEQPVQSQEELPAAPEPEVSIPQQFPVSPLPAQVQVQQPVQQPIAAAKPLTPAPSTRPPGVSVNRNHPRYKTDQAVVLPSSFGIPLEKVGMQFGSLSLGGDGTDEIIENNQYVLCRLTHHELNRIQVSLLRLPRLLRPCRPSQRRLRLLRKQTSSHCPIRLPPQVPSRQSLNKRNNNKPHTRRLHRMYCPRQTRHLQSRHHRQITLCTSKLRFLGQLCSGTSPNCLSSLLYPRNHLTSSSSNNNNNNSSSSSNSMVAPVDYPPTWTTFNTSSHLLDLVLSRTCRSNCTSLKVPSVTRRTSEAVKPLTLTRLRHPWVEGRTLAMARSIKAWAHNIKV
jgi:hypothetical protein